jgi:hypothetical protein
LRRSNRSTPALEFRLDLADGAACQESQVLMFQPEVRRAMTDPTWCL